MGNKKKRLALNPEFYKTSSLGGGGAEGGRELRGVFFRLPND